MKLKKKKNINNKREKYSAAVICLWIKELTCFPQLSSFGESHNVWMHGIVPALKREIQGTVMKLEFMEIAASIVTNW